MYIPIKVLQKCSRFYTVEVRTLSIVPKFQQIMQNLHETKGS